jgi:hypothetical protein
VVISAKEKGSTSWKRRKRKEERKKHIFLDK